MIVAYIDQFRDRFEVEPICRVLCERDRPIAPSTYYARHGRPVSPADWHDAHLANAALDLWRANRRLYGAAKLVTAMVNAGHRVGRDQVARLMGIVGIQGVARGKHHTVTTRRDPQAARHPDLVGGQDEIGILARADRADRAGRGRLTDWTELSYPAGVDRSAGPTGG